MKNYLQKWFHSDKGTIYITFFVFQSSWAKKTYVRRSPALDTCFSQALTQLSFLPSLLPFSPPPHLLSAPFPDFFFLSPHLLSSIITTAALLPFFTSSPPPPPPLPSPPSPRSSISLTSLLPLFRLLRFLLLPFAPGVAHGEEEQPALFCSSGLSSSCRTQMVIMELHINWLCWKLTVAVKGSRQPVPVCPCARWCIGSSWWTRCLHSAPLLLRSAQKWYGGSLISVSLYFQPVPSCLSMFWGSNGDRVFRMWMLMIHFAPIYISCN